MTKIWIFIKVSKQDENESVSMSKVSEAVQRAIIKASGPASIGIMEFRVQRLNSDHVTLITITPISVYECKSR